MRLRNVKYAKELIKSYPDYLILKPKKQRGFWNEVFNNDYPIELEIGCGKGKFIYEKAKNNPNINYIGIEKFDSVIVRALEKLIVEPLENLKLIRCDALDIPDIFSHQEISNLYLNFSDPWPKARHYKRRLTSYVFLDKYHNVLKEKGKIYIKTDNYPLFEFSMMSINTSNYFEIDSIALDLYKKLPDDNVQTEFEIKFVSEDKPIYYIQAKHKGEGYEKIL